jgi:hypothetical protein
MKLASVAGLLLAGAAAASLPSSPVIPLRPSAPVIERIGPPRVKGKNKRIVRKVPASSRGDKKRQRRAWANARETERQRTVAEGMAARAGVPKAYFYKQFGSLANKAA